MVHFGPRFVFQWDFLGNLNIKPNFYECQILLLFRQTVQHACITDVIMCKIAYYTRSPFVTWLSRRAQSGRTTSFGKRVWFIESHTDCYLFFTYCFIYSYICFLYKRRTLIQLKN